MMKSKRARRERFERLYGRERLAAVDVRTVGDWFGQVVHAVMCGAEDKAYADTLGLVRAARKSELFRLRGHRT